MQRQPARYDTDRMLFDAQAKGWKPIDLLRHADVKLSHGYMFLRGETTNAHTAKKLSKALGKPAGYYLIPPPAQRAIA